MTAPAKDKDHYFAQLALIADEMSQAYGQDFAMGALVLAARFIAERAAPARATAAAASPDPSTATP